MKAILIKNPYATQILKETKIIEYRSWDTKSLECCLVMFCVL